MDSARFLMSVQTFSMFRGTLALGFELHLSMGLRSRDVFIMFVSLEHRKEHFLKVECFLIVEITGTIQ